MTENAPLLEARELVRIFPASGLAGRPVRAVDGVSLTVSRGQALGLVGESGSGKSTVGRLLLRLLEPTAGQVLFQGRDLAGLGWREIMEFRRQAQIVFQDPFSSLDPRMTAGQIIAEPLRLHHAAPGREDAEARRLLARVGLQESDSRRYPFQFSGGQRQRISIARALALQPGLLIADEPVSALDVSVQAQIINLLRDLQQELGLALLFISHNLAVVRHLCTRTAVMQRGKIVEEGPTNQIFASPQHPYTRLLLSSILE
jgi:ABC-type oligopeptide transport system ATPase subunit